MRGALLACAMLTACTVAPARLRPVRGGECSKAEVAALCRTIVEHGGSAEGDAALGELVHRWPSGEGRDVATARCKVTFAEAAPGIYAVDYFDVLTPAAAYSVTKLRRHRRSGVGVPMLGLRENRHREPIEDHYPPEAITRPVTALARIDRGDDGTPAVRIELLDSLHAETVMVDGQERPLAADFTVPWVGLLERTGKLAGSWFSSLTDATPARDAQLYLMEPYDPDKTPLLMVHGLIATPIGWASVTNDLWGDPEIRRRYQVWHYHYPTAAPFLYSALVFRERIDEVRALLRDEGHGEIRPMVVIAHSMGGLLTKTLVTDSGEDAWKVVFARPSESLTGDPDDRALVNDILHWRARPHVRRVIFMAVPHRGSDTSRAFVGRVGARLAGVPAAFTGVYARLDRENPGALTPGFRNALMHGHLTSIDTLSPRHPMLPLLDAKPIAPWVTVHSIIGDRGKPGPLAESSDGVVPYSSSHLDTAASELVVHAGHRVYADPRAVVEVRRILALP